VALSNAIKERGAVRVLRLFVASISDKLRGLLGLPPVYIRLSAPLSDKSSLALVPLQDSEVSRPGAVRARCGGWRNLVMARAIVEALGYKPMDHLHNIRCPVFLRAATQDHLCPPDVIKAAAEQLAGAPEVFIHERNMTHLGAHQIGKTPSQIAPVIAFLKKHVYPQQAQEQQQKLNGHESPTGQTEVLADGVDDAVL
jgi:pimeloyl-ACP methyl ester carboxylesterase